MRTEDLRELHYQLKETESKIGALLGKCSKAYEKTKVDDAYVPLFEHSEFRATEEIMDALCHITNAQVFVEELIRICER